MARIISCVLTLLLATVSFASEPSTNPSTTKVKRDVLDLKVSASGAFEPVDPIEVRLRFKAYQGDLYILSVAAPGAQVAKGDTILQLDETQLKRQLTLADNNLTSAHANYEKAKSDCTLGDAGAALALKMQETELQNAVDGLKWWENVDGKHILEGADLQVQYSQDSVNDQQDELDQLKKMYKSEELTSATADIVVKRAIRALRNATTHLRMTKESSAKTKENDYQNAHDRYVFAVEQQKQSLEQVKAQQAQAKVLRDGAMVNAKVGLEQAEEYASNIKRDAEQFTIRAPQSMTVYYGQIANGSWSNNNPRSFRLGEKIILQPPHIAPAVQLTGIAPGKLRFVADVGEDKVLLLKKGQQATITPTAMPQKKLDGTLSDPARVITDGSSYNVVVNFSGDVAQIEPGMKGTMKLDPGIDEKVLLVPESAVKHGKVWMHQSDGSDKEVEVITGRSDGRNVEIVRGLGEGDEVLTTAKSD